MLDKHAQRPPCCNTQAFVGLLVPAQQICCTHVNTEASIPSMKSRSSAMPPWKSRSMQCHDSARHATHYRAWSARPVRNQHVVDIWHDTVCLYAWVRSQQHISAIVLQLRIGCGDSYRACSELWHIASTYWRLAMHFSQSCMPATTCLQQALAVCTSCIVNKRLGSSTYATQQWL